MRVLRSSEAPSFLLPAHDYNSKVRLRRIANLLQRHPRCADSKQRYFSVRRLPLRAEVTIYYVRYYANFRQLTPPFRKCRIFVPTVPLCAFRARGCVVPYCIVFRYVSLVFPFLKRRKKGKRSNNDRINDDA